MRIPIILSLLVILLLPADVKSLAENVTSYVRTATTGVGNLLQRNRVDVADIN